MIQNLYFKKLILKIANFEELHYSKNYMNITNIARHVHIMALAINSVVHDNHVYN